MEKDIQKELLDTLLVYVNEKLEKGGYSIGYPLFNFESDHPDFKNLQSLSGCSEGDLVDVLNACIARNYLDKKEYDGLDFTSLALTAEGQSRYIYLMDKIESEKSAILVGTMNINGNAQIGNKNNQTNGEDKEHGFERWWQNILKHPMVVVIVGVILTALFAYLKD